jgi:hypothetical protein
VTITNRVSLRSVEFGITPIDDVPDAPTIGAATNVGTSRAYNNGSATVAYTAAATGGPVTTFTATSTPGSFTGTGASPITVTGLQSATSYTFAVSAANANGTLTSAASSSITATTVPQAPTIGTVTVTNTTTLSVPFTAGATGGSAITSYTATSSPSIALSVSGTSTPLTVTGTFASNTSYTVQIVAVNANGSSSASSASNSVTPVPVYGRITRISPPVGTDEVAANSITTIGSNIALTGYIYTSGTQTAWLGVLDTNLANVAQNSYTFGGRTPELWGADTHPNGNLYVGGGNLGYSISVNPSTYATSLGKSNNNAVYNVTYGLKNNSADNYVFTCGWYNGTGDGMLIKRDSALSGIWGKYYSAEVFSYLHALAVEQETTGAVYAVGDIQENPRKGILMKVASSGAQTFVRSLSGGSGTTCILEDVKLASGTDPVVVGYYQSSGIIAKWNSSGTLQWQNGVSGSTFFGITLDANGSTVVGGNGYIIRFNNSGVVQWQRRITASAGTLAEGKKIYNDGTNFYAPFIYYPVGGGRSTIVIKMPLSGAGSGSSVVLGGVTFTYTTGSLTVASEGLTESSAYYPTNTFTVQDNAVSPTRADYTATLTNSAL